VLFVTPASIVVYTVDLLALLAAPLGGPFVCYTKGGWHWKVLPGADSQEVRYQRSVSETAKGIEGSRAIDSTLGLNDDCCISGRHEFDNLLTTAKNTLPAPSTSLGSLPLC
jgi:hypothetical protein